MQYIQNFKKYLPLLQELVSRDLKTKYRRSALGFLWTVLNPLGMMLVLTVVFSTVFQQSIDNFPVYLMCGQLVFNFYNEASNMAMNSIVDNAALIKKVYLPKYLFPVSRVCSALINVITSFVALLIVILITRTTINWTIFLSVFSIFYTLLFSLGAGMILSVLTVSFRDIKHLYGVIITAWMYLTPIFYPMSMLPPNLAAIIQKNPLTIFVDMMRMTVLYNKVPPFIMHFKCWIICGIVVVLGFGLFKKKQDTFILKL